MTEYVVTELNYREEPLVFAGLYEDGRLSELQVKRKREIPLAGKIFAGTVEQVSKNIGGAFVRIGAQGLIYLPLKKNEHLSASTRAVVQITADAAGGKSPVATRRLSLSGRSLVLFADPAQPAFSSRLTEEQKGIAASWLKGTECPYGILVRTNALRRGKQAFLEELAGMQREMDGVLERAERAESGALLYEPEPFYLSFLRDFYETPDRCLSDVPAWAAELSGLCPGQGETYVRLMPDGLTPAEHFQMIRDLDRLTASHVWLKSGGFVVIEKTEAFWSVDVNTGKCAKGRIPEETYRAVNLEAAAEIARQMRLRNMSGMILVDFITMRSADHKTELLNVMRKHLRQDHVTSEAVDLTPLGIMEILRRKVQKPLAEELGVC